MCNDLAIHTEHKSITANAIARRDPTRTTALRNAFVRDMNRRFTELTRAVTKAIVTEDVFGLLSGPTSTATVTFLKLTTPGKKRFAFPRDSRKVSAFMDWFNRQVNAGILDVREIRQVGESIEAAWTNKYINDSYKRGLARSRYQLTHGGFDVPALAETGGVGVSMMAPFHIDRVGLLYTRTFNELRGITAAMDQQISRLLAEGLVEGLHPKTLSRMLNHAISGKGSTLGLPISYINPRTGSRVNYYMPAQRRAQILARTEVIRAHSEAQLQEFKNWGVEGVGVKAEWMTAGDERVCPDCGALEGSRFTLEQAQGMLPLHPQCRCAWIPYDTGETVKTSRDAVADNIRDPRDAQKYLQLKQKFTDDLKTLLTDKDLKQIKAWRDGTGKQFPEKIKKYLSKNSKFDSIRDARNVWQNTADQMEPMVFKMRAEAVEKMAKVHFSEGSNVKWYKEIMDSGFISKDDYLNWRAFGQAYMDTTGGPKSYLLYRGNGGEFGEKIAGTLSDFMKGNRVRTKWHMTDSSLSGYSDLKAVGNKFGVENQGVTIRARIPSSDVIIPKDLMSGLSEVYLDEAEYIVKGLDRVVSVKNMSFDIDVVKTVPGVRGKVATTYTKEFGETLSEFKNRVGL